MTSRDEIDAVELLTDSLDNTSVSLPSLDLHSNIIFNSAAGLSDPRSKNNDPINDTVLYENQNLQDENLNKPIENLTDDLNFGNPSVDDDSCREWFSQQIFSSHHTSESSHSLDLHPNTIFNSAAGSSDPRSNDPINDTELNEKQNFQNENLMKPIKNLIEDNLNSGNLFVNDDSSREWFGQQLFSHLHLSNSPSFDKSPNDVETSFIDSPFDGIETYQLNEKPKIGSSSAAYENFGWDFNISARSGSGDNVPEREKTNVVMTGLFEDIGTFSTMNLKTECTGNGEDCRSFEKNKFETPENCKLPGDPLNSKNKILCEKLESDQNISLTGNILPLNKITRNYCGGDYLLNVISSDKNDGNLKISPEFASKTNSDKIKRVGIHGNLLENRKDGNMSTTNNINNRNINVSDRLNSYLELKIIADNFFKFRQQSSLLKNQRKELFKEVEAEIKAANSPSLTRDSSSIDKGTVNNKHKENLPSNHEPTEDNKFERHILNKNNLTIVTSSESVQYKANSNPTDKIDSRDGEDPSVTSKIEPNNKKIDDFDSIGEIHQAECLVFNQLDCNAGFPDFDKTESEFSLPQISSFETESDRFPTTSETLNKACLEGEMHIPAECQKDSRYSITNTFLSETGNNAHYRQIFNGECKNIDSASTSNLNSVQFMNITDDHSQNASLFEKTGNNFSFQELISDKKYTTEVGDVIEHTQMNIFKSKENSQVKCSSVTDANTTVQPFINESKTTENYLPSTYKTPSLFKKNVAIINSKQDAIFLENSKAKETEIKSESSTNLYGIGENSSESLSRQEKKVELNKKLFYETSIPLSVSDSNKGYVADDKEVHVTNTPLERLPTEECASNRYKEMESRRLYSSLEEVKYKLISPPAMRLVSQDIRFRKSLRLSNATNLDSNAESTVKTNRIKNLNTIEGNYVSTESSLEKCSDVKSANEEAKKTSSEDQFVCSFPETQMIKSYKIQPCTNKTIKKGKFISMENSLKTVLISDVKSNNGEDKPAFKRISSEDQTIHSLRGSQMLKSCKIQPESLNITCQITTKGDFVPTENPLDNVTISDIRSTYEEDNQPSKSTSPDQTTHSLRCDKILKSCKIQPESLDTTFHVTAKGDFVPTDNPLNGVTISSVGSTKEEDKQTSKRTSLDESIHSPRGPKMLKSCKIQPESLDITCQIPMKGDFVPPENPLNDVTISNVRRTKEDKQTSKRTSPDQSIHSLRDHKMLKSCKMQPGTLCISQTIENGNFVLAESLLKTISNSDIKSTNGDNIPSPYLRMAEILQKQNNKLQEPSFSKDEFEARIFKDAQADGNSSHSINSSLEDASTSQTAFNCTIAAVKQLNNENGSTVLDILSYIRTNSFSIEVEMISLYDVRRALKDATAAGFLRYANGKYTEIRMPIEENTCKEPVKRKTNRVETEIRMSIENTSKEPVKRKTNRVKDKTLSKRVQLAPSQIRSSRPKTTRLTKISSGKNPKDDSQEK